MISQRVSRVLRLQFFWRDNPAKTWFAGRIALSPAANKSKPSPSEKVSILFPPHTFPHLSNFMLHLGGSVFVSKLDNLGMRDSWSSIVPIFFQARPALSRLIRVPLCLVFSHHRTKSTAGVRNPAVTLEPFKACHHSPDNRFLLSRSFPVTVPIVLIAIPLSFWVFACQPPVSFCHPFFSRRSHFLWSATVSCISFF